MKDDMTIKQKLDRLDEGYSVDVSYANGILRSSKEATAFYEGEEGDLIQKDEKPAGYDIFHGIDGTVTYFTRKGIIEVMQGKRDPWDGDYAHPKKGA